MTSQAEPPRKSMAKTLAASMLFLAVVGTAVVAYLFSDSGKFARDCSTQISLASKLQETAAEGVRKADRALQDAASVDAGPGIVQITSDLIAAKNTLQRVNGITDRCMSANDLQQLTNQNTATTQAAETVDQQVAKIAERIDAVQTASALSDARRLMTSMKTGLSVIRSRAVEQLTRVERTPALATFEQVHSSYGNLKKAVDDAEKLDTSDSGKTRQDAQVITDRANKIRDAIDQINQLTGDTAMAIDKIERAQAEEEARLRAEEEQRSLLQEPFLTPGDDSEENNHP
ncbi:hypothetical protein ACTOVL_02320 [Arcanobacterium canis]